MAEFADLENAMSDVLGGLEGAAGPLLMDVAGVAGERAAALAALARMRKPAACVGVEGRESRSGDDPTPGDVRVTVWLAAESLRGPSGARLDDVEAAGVFTLAERSAGALAGAVVASVWRLTLREERVIRGDDRQVVMEQRYRAERLAARELPRWNGDVIVGSDALVTVEIGPLRTLGYAQVLAGATAELQTTQDVAELLIHWRGWLRASSQTALTDLENGLAARVGDGQAGTVTDEFGRSFAGCTVIDFKRPGPRRACSPTGAPMQAFELTFAQFSLGKAGAAPAT